MKDLSTITKEVRADIKSAVEHGTITIPPCVRINVHGYRRGSTPSVNVYFSLKAGATADDINDWKFTTNPDNALVLSDAVKIIGTRILAMIKTRSEKTSYGEINCYGTTIAIMIPRRNG